jgi:hypothetical protein
VRIDVAGRVSAAIPNLVVIISFGHVLWLLEKVGVTPSEAHEHILLVVCCAENIGRWWMAEHYKCPATSRRVSFPGDTAMPQSLMLVAIWLGTQEYAGIWVQGEGAGWFRERETLGFLGDSQMSALNSSMAIFGAPLQTQCVWCPTWYRSNFIAWAEEVVRVHGRTERPFNLAWSRPGQGVAWCGVLGCPYPYITVGSGSA